MEIYMNDVDQLEKFGCSSINRPNGCLLKTIHRVKDN